MDDDDVPQDGGRPPRRAKLRRKSSRDTSDDVGVGDGSDRSGSSLANSSEKRTTGASSSRRVKTDEEKKRRRRKKKGEEGDSSPRSESVGDGLEDAPEKKKNRKKERRGKGKTEMGGSDQKYLPSVAEASEPGLSESAPPAPLSTTLQRRISQNMGKFASDDHGQQRGRRWSSLPPTSSLAEFGEGAAPAGEEAPPKALRRPLLKKSATEGSERTFSSVDLTAPKAVGSSTSPKRQRHGSMSQKLRRKLRASFGSTGTGSKDIRAPLFGSSLETLIERQISLGLPSEEGPELLVHCRDFLLRDPERLAREGLFRINPSISEMRALQELLEGLRVSSSMDLEEFIPNGNPHVACALVKKFLRELEPRLLPPAASLEFLLDQCGAKSADAEGATDQTAADNEDGGAAVSGAEVVAVGSTAVPSNDTAQPAMSASKVCEWLALDCGDGETSVSLTPHEKAVARLVFSMLAAIAAVQDNEMSSGALAVVLAPNLFRSTPPLGAVPDIAAIKEEGRVSTALVTALIDIWPDVMEQS